MEQHSVESDSNDSETNSAEPTISVRKSFNRLPRYLRSLEEVFILKSSYLGRRTVNFSVFQRSRPSKIKHFFLIITMSKQTDIRYSLNEYYRYNLNLVYHFLGLQYLRFIIPHPHLYTHPTSELYNCCD